MLQQEIWLEEWNGKYQIRKESGAGNKVLDKRLWKCKSFDKAEKMFDQTIKQKTNPNRKWSSRRYQLIQQNFLQFYTKMNKLQVN